MGDSFQGKGETLHPTNIIMHHSLTDDGKTVSWGAIRKWHMGQIKSSPHQFNDIGYHYGVELINDRYEILVGRMMNKPGAHCKQKGMNHKSLGICVIGNFDKVPVPQGQWDLSVKLVKSLCETLGILKSNVFGHNEFAPKSCPGKHFDMDRFRREIKGR